MLEFLGESSWGLASFLTLLTGGLAFCYDVSPKFRYYFKFVVYIITVSFMSVFIIPIACFRPKDVRNALLLAPFINKVSALLGIKWEIIGQEHIAEDFPCIVTCNHQSILDFLGMVHLWPKIRKCAVVAKKDLIYIPPFGLVSWLCGTIFIDRSNPSESKTKMSASAESIHQNKTKMWIFPEGTRTRGSSLKPFKKGAFHLALQNKLPILPIVISPYTFLNDEKKTFDSGRVKISILPPVAIESYGPEDLNKLTETTYKLMNTEFQRLSLLANQGETKSQDSRNQTVFTLSLDELNSNN